MTYVLGASIAVLLFALIALYDIHQKAQSKWFIERQQMQAKIDTMTEYMLQQAGKPIDLNKHARQMFKDKAKQTFGPGWKRDTIATPPKENK